MEFVNSYHPAHFKSKEARETVRSHVTKRQHQKIRELHGKSTENSIPPTPTEEVPLFGLLKPGRNGLRALPRKRRPRRQQAGDGSITPNFTRDELFSSHSTETSATVFDNAAPPSFLPTLPLIFDGIEEFLQMMHDPLGWPSLGISVEEGRLWQSYMVDLGVLEPALRYTRLLFGAAVLHQHKVLRPEVRNWLYQRANIAVHEGLENKISEALILAIGDLTFYEIMFGDERRMHYVLRAQQWELIERHGGLEALRLPNVVKRVMHWEDAVIARQTGSKPMLIDGLSIGDGEMWNALALWHPAQFAFLISGDDVERC